MSDSQQGRYRIYAQRAGTQPYPIGWPDKSTLPYTNDILQLAIERCDAVYEGYVQVSSIPEFAQMAIQFTVRDGDKIVYTAGNI